VGGTLEEAAQTGGPVQGQSANVRVSEMEQLKKERTNPCQELGAVVPERASRASLRRKRVLRDMPAGGGAENKPCPSRLSNEDTYGGMCLAGVV